MRSIRRPRASSNLPSVRPGGIGDCSSDFLRRPTSCWRMVLCTHGRAFGVLGVPATLQLFS